ncbi:DUF805 domain-containing protein [Pseudomonas sp. KNUC1026]|uniref:DUF805 domain-containing protein n=1 Tax=Pseudomonas sp. KNUC1026 TaxID=2893890 RepID=UPI001F296790|nr:DUF805 domain-containing protein [Pseudomonas sp. KNUC1026]UFH49845.1 DUF805 domain-containing protein [Pseudomonas sp. KNUC1026]
MDGRIGRLRYFVWSFVATAALFAFVLVGALLNLFVSAWLGVPITLVADIAMVVLIVIIAGQRVHDLGWSAWTLLLMIIPLVNVIFGLVLVFMPGNKDANRFGAPPPPNSQAVKILAVVAVVVYVLSSIAYMTYFGALMAELGQGMNHR